MKEHDTFPGKVYAVTCASGCTITDNQGRTLGECEAGKQTLVVATSDKLLTSADALLTATFKYAPVKLMAHGLLGGGTATGSELPVGYLRSEFWENTNKNYGSASYIETGWQPEKAASVVFEGDVQMLGYGDVFNAFVSVCANDVKIPATIGFYLKDGTFVIMRSISNDGGMVRWTGNYLNKRVHLRSSGNLLYINGNLPSKTTYGYINLETFEYSPSPCRIGRMVKAVKQGYAINTVLMRHYEWYLYENTEPVRHYIPVLSVAGVPCMYDTVNKQTAEIQNLSACVLGFTLEQARQLGRLSKTGGALTVSLPSNYAEDEVVVNALATAQEKGWEITIQTYEVDAGAASTFGMRRIWVRRQQDEHGSYVDADGYRWQVDWCVTMYTPDGSEPDAHGYELFRSVDAAVAYWELAPYVDPAWEEEFLTNKES